MKYQEDTTKLDRVFNSYFGIHSKQYYLDFTKCTEQCFCLIFSTAGKKMFKFEEQFFYLLIIKNYEQF